MRFSAITALCAAPLALAGRLQAEVVPRGSVGVEVGLESGGSDSREGSSKGSYRGSSRESSSSSIDVSITEVIIIWVNEGGNAATSTMNSMQSFTSQGTGSSATHTVIVGGSGGLVYTPNTVEAAVGDMVIFTFMSNNHTATQSAFTTPCEKLAGGMDSGFMANVNNTVSPPPQMAMQVTVATPIWFYCRQSGHCGKGMTFSINPTANKTQAMFQQMAIAQNGTGTAGAITGGTAAAPPPPPPAASSSNSGMSGGSGSYMSSGSGSSSGGSSCSCSCLCGVAAFPNAAVQGVGMMGGMSGSMPMSALEA